MKIGDRSFARAVFSFVEINSNVGAVVVAILCPGNMMGTMVACSCILSVQIVQMFCKF